MIIECNHIEIKDEGNGKGKTIKVFGYEGLITTIEISPARLKGEWLDYTSENQCFFHATCSVCKIRNDIPPLELANFCPNCGADMRENKEKTDDLGSNE